jgi:hypothetical protein
MSRTVTLTQNQIQEELVDICANSSHENILPEHRGHKVGGASPKEVKEAFTRLVEVLKKNSDFSILLQAVGDSPASVANFCKQYLDVHEPASVRLVIGVICSKFIEICIGKGRDFILRKVGDMLGTLASFLVGRIFDHIPQYFSSDVSYSLNWWIIGGVAVASLLGIALSRAK